MAAAAATAGAAATATAGAATVMAEAARVLAEAATAAAERRMSVLSGRSRAAQSLSSAASQEISLAAALQAAAIVDEKREETRVRDCTEDACALLSCELNRRDPSALATAHLPHGTLCTQCHGTLCRYAVDGGGLADHRGCAEKMRSPEIGVGEEPGGGSMT